MVSPPARALAQTEEEAAKGDVIVQADAGTDKATKEDVEEKAETEEEEKKLRTRRSAAGSATPRHTSSAGQGT